MWQAAEAAELGWSLGMYKCTCLWYIVPWETAWQFGIPASAAALDPLELAEVGGCLVSVSRGPAWGIAAKHKIWKMTLLKLYTALWTCHAEKVLLVTG